MKILSSILEWLLVLLGVLYCIYKTFEMLFWSLVMGLVTVLTIIFGGNKSDNKLVIDKCKKFDDVTEMNVVEISAILLIGFILLIDVFAILCLIKYMFLGLL